MRFRDHGQAVGIIDDGLVMVIATGPGGDLGLISQQARYVDRTPGHDELLRVLALVERCVPLPYLLSPCERLATFNNNMALRV